MSLARSLAALVAVAGVALAAVEGAALAKKYAPGRPNFKAGDPEAYYIWYDDGGWHLRGTSGTKDKHTFHGVIRAPGGLSSVKPTREGLMKRIDISGESLRFEFEVGKGMVDGFDWQQTHACFTGEIKLDGKVQPSRVFVGLRSDVVDLVPFYACRE
jgi:hypothetical protein